VGTASSTCTIVMATFNGAKYLAEQLSSIENQALPPSKLIVSDDGSSDNTKQILASFAKRANFDVIVIDGPQKGYAENFWSAAKLADTKYLAWADQDDIWLPQKILRCVQALEETGAYFVSHSASVVDDELRPLGRLYPDYRRTQLLSPLQGDPFEVPSGFATMFRREILNEIDWDARPRSHQHDHLLPHDHAVGLIAFAFHHRVQLRESLAYYRQHDSNVAGDPVVTGFARVSTALKVSANNYARLAAYAERYAHYLAATSREGGQAAELFRVAAERARLREKLRDGKTLSVRLSSLIESAKIGNYRAKHSGGFGFSAFLNDSLALFLSINKSQLWGSEV
jgi:glycosyltransferase involved in cell wall biosynthesis